MKKKDSIINQISFSHDDRYVGAACSDEVKKEYNIDIYDTETAERLYTLATKGVKRTVAWHPKANILVYGGEEKKQGNISIIAFNAE